MLKMSDDEYTNYYEFQKWLRKVTNFYPETSVEHAVLSAIEWMFDHVLADHAKKSIDLWILLSEIDFRWGRFLNRIESETGIDCPEL